MYRLFKVPSVSLHGAFAASSSINGHFSSKLCFFCNFYHRNTPISYRHPQIRHNSSISTVPLTSLEKKKLKRRLGKKYVELLEVSNSPTTKRKASVRKLNASQLTELVSAPGATADGLSTVSREQVVRKSNTTNLNSRINSTADSILNTASYNESMINEFMSSGSDHEILIEDVEKTNTMRLGQTVEEDEELFVEDLKASGISDEAVIIESSSIAESLYANSESLVDHAKNEEDSTSVEIAHNEEAELMKEEIATKDERVIEEEKRTQFTRTLLGYMDVCANSEMLIQGYNTLLTYRNKTNKPVNFLTVKDASIFNILLRKYALNPDLIKTVQLLKMMKDDNITMSPETYAFVFECIGRLDDYDDSDKIGFLHQVHGEMKKDGISLNDIMTKSTFLNDQRDVISKTVKLLDANFEPTYELSDLSYDCKLLERLSEKPGAVVSPIDGVCDVNHLKQALDKQMKLESEGHVKVANIARLSLPLDDVVRWRKKLASLEKTWHKAALQAFSKNLDALKAREAYQTKGRMVLFPYLSILKPEDYISVLMHEIHKLGAGSEMYSLPFIALSRTVGVQVSRKYEMKIKETTGVLDKTREVYLKYCDWYANRTDDCNSRVKWKLIEHETEKYGVSLNAEVPEWPENVYVSIGKFLLNIAINELKIDVNFNKKQKSYYIPAFFKIFRNSGYKIKEEIKPHPLVAKLYRDAQPEQLTFDVTLVPSLCPPRPWTSIKRGGYVIAKADIVRITSGGNQQWDRLTAAPENKLFPALDSLNQLSATPWRINTQVLDVALEVFQNNGSEKLNMPQPPSVLPPLPPLPQNATSEDKKIANKAKVDMKRKKNEMYSLWCDALYRLSLANHFRNDVFWLPHNMDFRGRVYPIPPHLNHLGSDMARSMLIFAQKKPLGPKGLDWLKIHAINLTGLKKRDPIIDRLKYANEIMDKIVDSAENPLTGEMWWAESDEPWQTLAACKEIVAASNSPNPAEYMTGFPIHQDGSCNGLQHYAALGRDQIGAESVNLHPRNMPQDVYSSVATMVDQIRQEDAENGLEIAQVLDGFIKRKVIKQTVMTTVYGVTWFGAKLQIARQLKDMDDFPQEYLWPASTYLVHKTFQTLRTMFKSAREIQDWFTECARMVCSSRDENMEWITPLGLPVVQPYSKIVRPLHGNVANPVFTSDVYRKPNIMKQKNAFAPNYVHSLDSSHMMLTSLYSEHVGISFVSVHDCFWTHPCTVEVMNTICREQFVALHSQPILDDLSKFLLDKFGFENIGPESSTMNKKILLKHRLKEKLNSTLVKVPKLGDFDLNGVMHSTYFFS